MHQFPIEKETPEMIVPVEYHILRRIVMRPPSMTTVLVMVEASKNVSYSIVVAFHFLRNVQ